MAETTEALAGAAWDTRYERRAVLLLMGGFGLVGLDRWIISPLFPAMMQDLHLTYQDLGNLIAALGVAWGVFAAFGGSLSDRFGRKRVLIPALVGFSLLSGLSGLASGLGSLLLVRLAMGASEGAFCPTSFACTAEASHPARRGLNQGIQQSAFALLGLGFGPVIATQLLAATGSWRTVFLLVGVPGLILALALQRTIREPVRIAASALPRPRLSLAMLGSHRNIILGMLALLCAMTGVFVLSAMVPSYLVEYRHLSTAQMGVVTSAIGFGGFLGQVTLAGLSDRFGRKPVALIGFVGAALVLIGFIDAPTRIVILFALLFVSTFFCFGLLGLITGPIAVEAAPVGLMSSTAGLIIGVGEVFGGGVAPVFAGYVAQHQGIDKTLFVALGGMVAGAVLCLFLRETAPRKRAAAPARLQPAN